MVQVNTDKLEFIAKGIAELESKRFGVVEEFLKEMLEAVNVSLLKCKAEYFIFNVYGSYEHTLAFSSRGNKTQSVKFDRIYVGIIGNGGLINTSHDEKYLSVIHGNHFKISCTKLFQLDILSSHPFKFTKGGDFEEVENPEVYLQSQKRDSMSWTLTDVALSAINSPLIEKNIWSGRTSDVKTLLIVGNEECKAFVDRLKDESSAKDIWKRKKIFDALHKSEELKSILSL